MDRSFRYLWATGNRRTNERPDRARAPRASTMQSPPGSQGHTRVACTPEMLPDLTAVAIQKQDISLWASERNLTTPRGQAEPRPD